MKGQKKYAAGLAPYAPAVLKLLVNPLFSDDAVYWNQVLTYQNQIQDYLEHIGLALEVQEIDGYAYLYQPEIEDEEGTIIVLPRITRRDRLSFHATLLCVLLREWLDQQEAQHLDSSVCFITGEQIHEMMLPFLPERNDTRKVTRRIDTAINQISELGYLKRFDKQQDVAYYEVRRILRARIEVEKLGEIKEKLQHSLSVSAEEQEDE